LVSFLSNVIVIFTGCSIQSLPETIPVHSILLLIYKMSMYMKT